MEIEVEARQYPWNGFSGWSYLGFEYRVRGFVTQHRVSLF